jgi:glycosyltransferase involved in cell wall biosynthesis
VIGDACTDNTAEVMASFTDPRIHFLNLAINTGNMAGPNNEGARHVRAPFVAYHNHDDRWLPDHLEVTLEVLNRTGAALVYAEVLEADPAGGCRPQGQAPGPKYDPYRSVPASSWVLRREMLDIVGPWRLPAQIYNVPSQDWLFRAWRRGLRMIRSQPATVLSLPSGFRQDCYHHRDDHEQSFYAPRILAEPDFREREWRGYAARLAAKGPQMQPHWLFKPRTARNTIRTMLFVLRTYPARILKRFAPLFGVSPFAVEYFFRFGRRGGFLAELRRVRGLEQK